MNPETDDDASNSEDWSDLKPREPRMPRTLTEREMELLEIHHARQERYLRTARFVQSKWFMIGGALAIAVFLLLVFLVSSF